MMTYSRCQRLLFSHQDFTTYYGITNYIDVSVGEHDRKTDEIHARWEEDEARHHEVKGACL